MLLTRKRGLFDLADLSWFPFLEPVLRIEEYQKDDRFVVRAEIPGIDPAKDLSVVAEDGLLRITAVRLDEQTKEGSHTEFRYGSFHRTVPLPPGAKQDTISASYANGILEITMAVGEPVNAGRAIPIAVPDLAVPNIAAPKIAVPKVAEPDIAVPKGQPKPVKKS